MGPKTLLLESLSRPSVESSVVFRAVTKSQIGHLTLAAIVASRITKNEAAQESAPWMWTLAHGQHEDRTHGDEGDARGVLAAGITVQAASRGTLAM